jgi:magnesium transporter
MSSDNVLARPASDVKSQQPRISDSLFSCYISIGDIYINRTNHRQHLIRYREIGALSFAIIGIIRERSMENIATPSSNVRAEPPRGCSGERAADLAAALIQLDIEATSAPHRLANALRQMQEPARSQILQRLDIHTPETLRSLFAYPQHSAGNLMTKEFVSVPADWSIEQTIEHIRCVGRTRETIYAVYVVDALKKALLQAVSLQRLITSEPKATVLSAAQSGPPISVVPLADREEVARLISKYDLLAVPVVNGAGQVLGIVTAYDVIDAIVQENTEDMHRFGGVQALNEPYLRTGFGQTIQKRAGWLSALFVSEMLTASAMQFFQGELEKAIVLTLFIPLIMSSGGNSGSQATSLLIRALALGELQLRDWWRVAIRELPTGIVLGAILGSIAVGRIMLWQHLGFYDYGEHWLLIALTVAAALVGIVTFGSVAGSMLPFVLQRLGFDPASASAPFVATLVDVTGLVIYFGVAALILKGTLL